MVGRDFGGGDTNAWWISLFNFTPDLISALIWCLTFHETATEHQASILHWRRLPFRQLYFQISVELRVFQVFMGILLSRIPSGGPHSLDVLSITWTQDTQVEQCRETLHSWSVWAAQSFGRRTLHFSSGHAHRVMGSSPISGSTLSVASAWDRFPLPLCPSPSLIKMKILYQKETLSSCCACYLGGQKHVCSWTLGVIFCSTFMLPSSSNGGRDVGFKRWAL